MANRRGDPLWKCAKLDFVSAERCMPFTDLGEPVSLQFAGEPDKCRPDPPMHVGNLSVYKPADQHIRRIPHQASQREDLVALRVAPPVSANALTSRGVGECDHRSVRRLEYDPVPLDKL